MNEYEIGKDVGDIQKKLEILEERVANLEDCKCGSTVEQIATPNIMATENNVQPMEFNWNRSDAGDCEIRKESVILYPDGRFRDIAELKDHGSAFGDTFSVTMSVLAGDTTVAMWRWKVDLSAGEDFPHDKSGIDSGIATHWNEITGINRRFICK
ncbi:hypothetical protein OCB72_23355 [Bacillus cereus]|nr:hypothetical protein [Bacillus cereus]